MPNDHDRNDPISDSQGQTTPPPPVIPSAPLQGALPDDGKRKADDTKNEADELAREFRAAEKWVIGTNITLAIIGIFALCIYHGQLNVMRGQLGEIIRQYPELQKSAQAAKDAADVGRESLESVQRAFVFQACGPVNPQPQSTQIPTYVPFVCNWENGGSTPTKSMLMRINFKKRLNPLPKHFDFADIWENGEAHVPMHLVIGAHASAIANTWPIPMLEAQKAIAENKIFYYYIWGWATYHDVLPNTPEHVTKFCLVWRIGGYLMPEHSPLFPSNDETCSKHNCYDDECKK